MPVHMILMINAVILVMILIILVMIQVMIQVVILMIQIMVHAMILYYYLRYSFIHSMTLRVNYCHIGGEHLVSSQDPTLKEGKGSGDFGLNPRFLCYCAR